MRINFLSGYSPATWGDPPINEPVRHAIDFSLTNQKVNFPRELESFNQFIYNSKKKRISFRVSNNSSFRAQFSKTVYSQDENKHKFNELFIKSNPHLVANKDFKIYDFIDLESAREEGSKGIFIQIDNIENEIPKKINTGINLLLIGAGLFLLYKSTPYLLSKTKIKNVTKRRIQQ